MGSRPAAPSDALSPGHAFWKWSAIGAVVAGLLIVAQISSVGGLSGLLQVGADSPLRPVIEEQLGPIAVAEKGGHDGQIYYAIGLDLDGDEMAEFISVPAYRYRRIFFSALSSGFGSLEGEALLLGMVATVVIATAVASGAVAACARKLGRSDWLALAVVANPGIWLSIWVLTADVLATALMALGLLGVLYARNRASILSFTASVLTKEAHFMTPAGLVVSRDKRRWLVGAIPLAAIVVWTIWVGVTVDAGASGVSNNISLPFAGIVRASSEWPKAGPDNWFYVAFALVSVTVALVVGLARRSWLRWSLLAWAALGVCASSLVWRIGNNAARAFAPVVILIVLSIAERSTEPSSAPAHREVEPTTQPASP